VMAGSIANHQQVFCCTDDEPQSINNWLFTWTIIFCMWFVLGVIGENVARWSADPEMMEQEALDLSDDCQNEDCRQSTVVD
jgi:hypothetical protein